MKNKIDISIVVPIYNEQDNIESLHAEILSVFSKIKLSFEVIYINDGSTDNSFSRIHSLEQVKIIDLNKNYGQAVALDAGFKEAKGDLVVSIDGDGQNNPKDIPKMIEKLKKENLDVVSGRRFKRKDNLPICIISSIGRFFRKLFIGDTVYDSGSTFRVYKKEAAKSLDIDGEMHRYILALLKWKGFKLGEIKVSHRKRKSGQSKYNLLKAVRGFIDLVYVWFIYKYSQRPLHLFGYISLFCFFLSFLTLFYSFYQRIFINIGLSSSGWFFIGFFLFIVSILFFSFGIVIDLLIKIQLTSSPYEKRYYIKKIIDKSD